MWSVLLSAAVLAVPFVPQEKDTCGAASLAMVLRYWEHPVAQGEIAAELFEPELAGIRGSRLADFARRRGFLAIAYAGDLDHLRAFVGKGRPIIVAWRVEPDRFHDVVVVGFDEARGDVVVHDPALGPSRRVGEEEFERLWAGSRHWALVVLPEAE